MYKKILKRKFIVLPLLTLLVISNFTLAFAYWASSVSGDTENSDASLTIGDWINGSPI
ncbi:MAG: hypothetical protein WCR19_05965 [Acholeplasmataceae bacterium]